MLDVRSPKLESTAIIFLVIAEFGVEQIALNEMGVRISRYRRRYKSMVALLRAWEAAVNRGAFEDLECCDRRRKD